MRVPELPKSKLALRDERRLVQLLFARLALTVLSFGIAIGLDGMGTQITAEVRLGLYSTVAVAFASTILSGVLLGRVQRPLHFATLQIATDVGIVTSLVHFSGGRESVFTFLYVVVTLYGAVLFERRGAMFAASLSAAAYAGLVFGERLGWVPAHAGNPVPLPVLFAIWGVHVGALYLVGVLASLLSSELQRTGRALDQSTSDLQRLRDLHERTVESIMSGLLTTDREGRVMSFNPEAERITGFSLAGALGRNVESVIPGATAQVLHNPKQSSVRAQAARSRLAYTNRAGRKLYLGIAASILKDREGEPQGHVVIFRDVTGVVEMERELSRSERLAALGEMAAKIAHEIRNPLASISGSIQILNSSLSQQEQAGESGQLMDIVIRETDRLNTLINDFLQYSHPGPSRPEELEVCALVADVCKLAESSCSEDTQIRFESDGQWSVYGDPDQLRQVLWNLMINGIQAMPDGGTLHVRVETAWGDPPQEGVSVGRNASERADSGRPDGHPWIEISVRDTGVGIDAEVQERIFEPFFTTKREGTGLGLATVHRIVQSHGGALGVESELGRGTTFCVRLPIWESSQ